MAVEAAEVDVPLEDVFDLVVEVVLVEAGLVVVVDGGCVVVDGGLVVMVEAGGLNIVVLASGELKVFIAVAVSYG